MKPADLRWLAHTISQTVEWLREYHADRLPGAAHTAGALADALAKENPRMDKARFLRECGLD